MFVFMVMGRGNWPPTHLISVEVPAVREEGPKGRRVTNGLIDAKERAVESKAQPVALRDVKVALERGKGSVDHRRQEHARVLLVDLRDAAVQFIGAFHEDWIGARLSGGLVSIKCRLREGGRWLMSVGHKVTVDGRRIKTENRPACQG